MQKKKEDDNSGDKDKDGDDNNDSGGGDDDYDDKNGEVSIIYIEMRILRGLRLLGIHHQSSCTQPTSTVIRSYI